MTATFCVSDTSTPSLYAGHRETQVSVQRGKELLCGQVRRIRPDEQRQVLRHLAALDRLDADPLEGPGEPCDLSRAVQLAAVRQPARPGEDGRDRVGRGRLALLVLPVVPGHGAMRGL